MPTSRATPQECLRDSRFARIPASLVGQDPEPMLTWAAELLAGLGCAVTGEPAWLRARHWSTVAQVPTTGGHVWVKANAAGFAHEGPLLSLLAALAPDTVLEPHAIDADRGWLILPDGGPTLRQQQPDHPEQAWRHLLSGYARAQQRWMSLAEPAALAGTPDVRGALILDILEQAGLAALDADVHGEHRLTAGESAAVLALAPQLAGLAEELAASAVPCTVEHNDPHPGNVFAGTGRLFDFGDAVIGHPFLGLASALPDAAGDLGVPVTADPVTILRDGYLGQFDEFAAPEQLRRDATVASVLAHLPRAATWLRVVPAGRAQWPAVLPDRMRALLRSAAAIR